MSVAIEIVVLGPQYEKVVDTSNEKQWMTLQHRYYSNSTFEKTALVINIF